MRRILRLIGILALLVMTGCRVREPGKHESGFMNWVKHKITVGGKKDRNPLGHGPDVVEQGKTAFATYCIVCHGLDAQNTGVPFAAQMAPPIPSLASRQIQDYTDGQLKWIIENGVSPSGMPASRGILSEEELWSIVVYLRHLPAAGSLGEPPVYSGECNLAPPQSSSSETIPKPPKKRKSAP